MGLYRYITEEEIRQLKTVKDETLNEILQEALKYDDSLLVEEQICLVQKAKVFPPRKEIKGTIYTVYHESPSFDGSAYQAQYMSFATNVDRNIVAVYLFGIINCGLKARKDSNNE